MIMIISILSKLFLSPFWSLVTFNRQNGLLLYPLWSHVNLQSKVFGLKSNGIFSCKINSTILVMDLQSDKHYNNANIDCWLVDNFFIKWMSKCTRIFSSLWNCFNGLNLPMENNCVHEISKTDHNRSHIGPKAGGSLKRSNLLISSRLWISGDKPKGIKNKKTR